MTLQRSFCVAAIFGLLIFSLMLKWQRYRYEPSDSLHQAGEIVMLEMQRSGFTLQERKSLTKDGSYQVLVFTKPGCEKPTLIEAMGNNTEGLALFTRFAAPAPTVIVFAGAVYADMPALRIQWQRLVAAVNVLLRLPNNTFSRVLAVSPPPESVPISCRFDIGFNHPPPTSAQITEP